MLPSPADDLTGDADDSPITKTKKQKKNEKNCTTKNSNSNENPDENFTN